MTDGKHVDLTPLTHEQRVAATNKSIADRRIRADVKERLKTGSTTLKQVLAEAESNEAVAKLRVTALLQAIPGVGSVRAMEVIKRFDISPNRRVRGLGARQRQALLNEFA